MTKRLFAGLAAAVVGWGCAAPCNTDVYVSDVAGLEALAGCEVVEGLLYIEAVAGVKVISLPKLREVTREIRINLNPDLESVKLDALERTEGISIHLNPRLKTASFAALVAAEPGGFGVGSNELAAISAPRLERVGTGLGIQGGVVSTIAFPALKEVGAGLAIEGVLGLKKLDLPRVERIGSDIYLAGNGQLETFDLGGLTSLVDQRGVPRNIDIRENVSLTSYALGPIERVGIIDFDGNTALPEVWLPASITSLARLRVKGSALTTSVRASGLRRIDSLEILTNASLDTLDLPALRSLGSYEMYENPALATCTIQALEDQVRAADGIDGNAIRHHNKEDECGS